MTDTTKLSLRCTALRAVLPFAAAADVRDYLNGIVLRPAREADGVVAVASNGHCLAVAHDSAGVRSPESRALFVPRLSTRRDDWSRSILAPVSKAGAKADRAYIHATGLKASVSVGQLTESGDLLDVTPPNYLHAIDTFQSTAMMGIDADYLGRVARAFTAIGANPIIQTGGLTGALRAFGEADGIRLLVIVMARRDFGTTDIGPVAGLPPALDWVRDALAGGAL